MSWTFIVYLSLQITPSKTNKVIRRDLFFLLHVHGLKCMTVQIMYSRRLYEIHLRIAFKITFLNDDSLFRGGLLDEKSH